ncbi:MAG: hypothetical protein IJK31_00840 [Ruminococcus sp.]|nr:hypothetical protein [Ruminococcus sp.]
MNNMKRFAAVLAVVLGICPLSSCGGSGSSKKSDSSSKIAEEEEVQPITSKDKSIAIENDDSEDEDEASAEKETEAPEKDNSEAGSTEDGELTLGEISGNVYTSRFNGLKITAPEGYEIINGDELDEFMNMGAKDMNLESSIDAASLVTVSDVDVVNTTTGANISIIYEDLSKTVADPESYSAEDYFEQSKKAAAAMGLDMDMGEVSKTQIAGQEYYTRSFTYNVNDDTVGMQTIIRKIGHYMMVITYSTPINDTESSFDEFKDFFSTLD